MTNTFYGYTKQIQDDQFFDLPDTDKSGFCCMIWEVSEHFSKRLKRDGVDCPEGYYFVCGDDDKGVADKAFGTFDEASNYCYVNMDCRHLYLKPDTFIGCSKCNCKCGNIH